MIPRKHAFVALSVAAIAALWPADAAAQRSVARRPHVRTVFVGARYAHPVYYYRPVYYRPFYYRPFYYDPFFWGTYQYGPYPPYPPYRYGPAAEIRLQVTPRDAEVYVDGYLAGTVDDFDGVFQRLRAPIGEHEIAIYRDGYRTVRQKMLLRPFESYRIRETLQPLGAGDPPEARPVPGESGRTPGPYQGGTPGPSADQHAEGFGALAVRVQPADSVVLIDGERWEAPSGSDRLLVRLSAGTHRIEIRKEGYRTYSSVVTIRNGETATVNVSLPPAGEKSLTLHGAAAPGDSGSWTMDAGSPIRDQRQGR